MPIARTPNPTRQALALLCLALAGRSTTQIYPTLQEQRISLRAGELEIAGLAFITPPP